MNDQPIEIVTAPARGTPNAGQTGARIPLDAVGRFVAVDDMVTAHVGARGALAVVERVSGSRLVVRRGDGMKAVLDSGSVVVVQKVDRSEAGRAS